MASQPKSKWVDDDNDAEAAEAAAQRRREKEEKRRLKEEKAKAAVAATAASSQQAEPSLEYDSRPAKRPRTEDDQEAKINTDQAGEGSHLLQLPSRGFGASRNVDEFELLNSIEEGSYGMVSRARTKATGEIVALKRLKMEQAHAANEGFPVTGLREIQTLQACRHPNIVSLREIVVGDTLSDVYLVMEFVEHDLSTLQQQMAEPFLPSEVKTLMQQAASALAYLHAHHILHRDLKTSNLLLTNRGTLKLADFGMARYTSSPPPAHLTQLVVTLWYRAPELLLGAATYGPEIDAWSLGCVFGELLTQQPLLPGANEVQQLSLIVALVGAPTAASWPGFRALPNAKALHPLLAARGTRPASAGLDATRFPHLTAAGLRLLSSLLSLDPEARPSARGVLAHPFFSEAPKPKPQALFPTFPSKAGQERRRRAVTPSAPVRGDAPKLDERDFVGLFGGSADEPRGAGFALRWG